MKRCKHCGLDITSANGIWVHILTGRPDSTVNGFHYAKPRES